MMVVLVGAAVVIWMHSFVLYLVVGIVVRVSIGTGSGRVHSAVVLLRRRAPVKTRGAFDVEGVINIGETINVGSITRIEEVTSVDGVSAAKCRIEIVSTTDGGSVNCISIANARTDGTDILSLGQRNNALAQQVAA